MGLGWGKPPEELWEHPINKPRADSWTGLVHFLDKRGPRDTEVSRLRVYKKEKVRKRDRYQCRLQGCSSGFEPPSSPGEWWIEGGERTRRPQNKKFEQYIGQHLEVHHIIQVQNMGRNVPKNLITLCKSCHTELHSERGEQVPEWERDFGPI
jgi:hypothetical protein